MERMAGTVARSWIRLMRPEVRRVEVARGRPRVRRIEGP